MDFFNKISISHFIWYLVPGAGLLFFCLFPVGVFNLSNVNSFLNTAGPFGIILLGIIGGFSLDGLRLYRLRYGYNDVKTDFFTKLQEIFPGHFDSYFLLSIINDLARAKKASISLNHAIWIMHGHFSIMSFLQSIFWFSASGYSYFGGKKISNMFGVADLSNGNTTTICFLLFVFFLILGLRFQYISSGDQQTTNNMFINFASQHKEEIRKIINVSS